ncbi:MAG TPA: sugar phosphate isomerase/epimerase [Anaerolineales bacterium]|nr:sugar phosphate isomerase/epimerase [Anaerolineales bacterium]
MKFGVNTFVWVSPFSSDQFCDLAARAKEFGFDILELAIENPDLVDVVQLKRDMVVMDIEVVICGAFGSDRNLASADPAPRENAEAYIRWLIDAASELGSKCVCGPMYSSVGKEHLNDAASRLAEWERAVSGVRQLAEYAAGKGVCLALEPLNRFETDMINVVDQGLRFIMETGMDNVGLHLDTFHMHLEEKSTSEAIRRAGKKIFHFHACENDRGVPGTGQVHWAEIAQALIDVGYDGPVVIESFTSQVKEIARAVCIWREIAPSQDAIAKQGLLFLKTILS